MSHSFDGFGSYPEYMQFSNMFKNIGRIGIEMYLLFQHHTTLEILRNVSDDTDLFTITGTGWHFVKFLGPAVACVAPDTRSERNPNQVMAGPSYQGLFPKIAMLPQSVQHCIFMLPVPLIYPRLEAAESIAHSVATGKKTVTGAYNMLGKVTSSVAGVVGAKGAVASGFDSVKRAVGKSGLMGGILSPFGDIDMLDELKDQWTHESKVERHPISGKIHTDSPPGSRANIPYSYAARHLTPTVDPYDLSLWLSQYVWSWPRPRPISSFRPQDNVSAHLLFSCQHSSTIVCAQTTQQQQALVYTTKRATKHTFTTDRY